MKHVILTSPAERVKVGGGEGGREGGREGRRGRGRDATKRKRGTEATSVNQEKRESGNQNKGKLNTPRGFPMK